MNIESVLMWTNKGVECPKEQATEVWLHVTMDEDDDELILQEEGIKPEAFSVIYQFKPREKFTLQNEGHEMNDWMLQKEEKVLVRNFYKLQI